MSATNARRSMYRVMDCSKCGREERPHATGLCKRCRKRGRGRAEGRAIALAKERDRACLTCGVQNNLQGHHVIPVCERPDLAADLGNIVTLCGDCHADKHPELPRAWFRRG